MPRLLSAILLLLALPSFGSPALSAPPPGAAKEVKRVLVLYTLDKHHPGHVLTERGIRKELEESAKFDVRLYEEFLDKGRFPGEDHAKAMAEYLRSKYRELEIDAIVTVYPDAADFVLRQSFGLFPTVPVVAGEMVRSYAQDLERSPLRQRVTGTILGDNIAPLLEDALRLKPDTRRVALVAGSSPLDAHPDRVIRAGLHRYGGQVELIDLTKLPMRETLARVGTLPPNTLVFYSSIVIDGAGVGFVPREALALVSRASNSPVFGIFDSYLGAGVVGGHLVSFELQGRVAAGLLLKILAGASPGEIPIKGEEAFVHAYDWRELERWGIPERAIPPGGTLLYHQPSLWEAYRWAIVGAVVVVLVEAALIVGLLVNLWRRRTAERSLSESELRLKLAVDAAGAGFWSLEGGTGRIWANDRAKVLYGVGPGEAVDYDRFIAVVHEEDRAWVGRAVEEAFRERRPLDTEYRIRLPDGNVRWISIRSRFHLSPEGIETLSGVSVDVTGIKNAEEALRQRTDELTALMKRLVTAQEEERSRVARELHDDITQRLAVVTMGMAALEQQRDLGADAYRERFQDVRTSLVKVSEDIHDLSRQLHPSILDDLGLVRALEAESGRFSEKEGIRVLFDCEGVPESIPRDVALALYRVAQEGLRNVARHSGARSAHLKLGGAGGAVRLTVADTGRGFDPLAGRRAPGMGLASMRERIDFVRGSLTVDSSPGEGTIVEATVPLEGAPP